jgi:hypothetical protein
LLSLSAALFLMSVSMALREREASGQQEETEKVSCVRTKDGVPSKPSQSLEKTKK